MVMSRRCGTQQRSLGYFLDLRSQALALPVSCATEGRSESKALSTLLVSTLFYFIFSGFGRSTLKASLFLLPILLSGTRHSMDIKMKAPRGKVKASEELPTPLLLKLGDGYMEALYAILSTFT